ncbi:MAG: zinc-ribbon domain-containing protein [Abitibacteriaceae bacterium]|nr:zinc-ribbon domain-containing protein [Abditibacteriaceae bacterium]MBV9866725.1 zinc-ribbon domain-containing protein [Abditibacteriaceae bacterium]
MALNCRHCGVQVPDNEDFCPRCGACANCGLLRTELPTSLTSSAFCPNCGASLRVYRQEPNVMHTAEEWGGVLLKMLAIGILGFICFGSALCGGCSVMGLVGSGLNWDVGSFVASLLSLLFAAFVFWFGYIGIKNLNQKALN